MKVCTNGTGNDVSEFRRCEIKAFIALVEILLVLYKDWSIDPETAVDEDGTPLADFPNYGRLRGVGSWSQKIFFAGTETSSEHGGHLEGALQSAEQAVSEVIQLYRTT